jgi:hypothetical protein
MAYPHYFALSKPSCRPCLWHQSFVSGAAQSNRAAEQPEDLESQGQRVSPALQLQEATPAEALATQNTNATAVENDPQRHGQTKSWVR